MPIAIEGAEDLVLHGIGILKFIKERGRIVGTDSIGQCAVDIRRKCRVQIEQQIIVGLNAPLGLECPLSGVGTQPHVMNPFNEVRPRSFVIGIQTGHQGIQAIEERMLGH